MGIDIGGLDAAILSGYPGTIMSAWQQAGRAGRQGRDALVFMVASQNPLDQYYMQHPQAFFAQPHERAVVDLHNQRIWLRHLLCAARELPFSHEELARLPKAWRQALDELYEEGLLSSCALEDGSEGLCFPSRSRDVHLDVSLRSASQETYRILDENRNEIGTIEPPNVYREAHPGAIYQHGGENYRVTFLDRRRKIVRVREEYAPHYTRSSSRLSLTVERRRASRKLHGEVPLQVCLGDVLVEETVYGYQELEIGSERMVKRVNLSYPLTMRLHTVAVWLELPSRFLWEVLRQGDEGVRAGLHAIQHLLTGVMPLLIMCDRRDVGGFYHLHHPDLGTGAIFLYDAYAGGIGLAEVAFQRMEELLVLAHETVSRCPCEEGCPSCIQSGTCRLGNQELSKGGAQAVLASLLVRSEREGLPGEERLGTWVPDDLQMSRRRALEELLRRFYPSRRGPLPKKRAAPQRFSAGDVVEHPLYGLGVVLGIRRQGEEGGSLLTVRFVRRGITKEVEASQVALRSRGHS